MLCNQCSRLVPRPLHEADISGRCPRQHVMKNCSHCKEGKGYPTVQFSDIPAPLQGLSKDVLWALLPLQVENGREMFAEHGYQIKSGSTRFIWRPNSVKSQIQGLERLDRKSARNAYDFLMASSESSYKWWVDAHIKFLRAHAGVDPNHEWWRFQLPQRCIEEVGIECACWPHLYPRTVTFEHR